MLYVNYKSTVGPYAIACKFIPTWVIIICVRSVSAVSFIDLTTVLTMTTDTAHTNHDRGTLLSQMDMCVTQ